MSKADRTAAAVIDGDVLYKYASCPHWPYFDRFGEPKRRARLPKFSDILLRADLFDEARILGVPAGPAAARAAGWTEAAGRTRPARRRDTLRLMREGARFIRRGLLLAGDLAGEPDLLERLDGEPSELGAYRYAAVDVKNTGERLSDGHRYQLALYGELLRAVQGVRPRTNFIIDLYGIRRGLDLEEFAPDFQAALDDLRGILGGARPLPHLGSGCRRSPWLRECIALAEKTDDIALLYSIRDSTAAELRTHGVRTVAEAAVMDVGALKAAWPEFHRKTLERLAAQARALVERRHFRRKPIGLPASATEIFFDIEGDPPRRLEYLLGLTVRGADGVRYESFIAEDPEDESGMWRRFLDRLETLPPGSAVYHFGDYEPARLSLLESRYGGSPALERFRSALVDLNEIIKDAVVLPLYFYGLKDIGAYIGFDRSGKIAGGAESVAFYEAWLGRGDRRKLDAIVRYNEEDTLATLKLTDGLAGLAAEPPVSE